MQKIYIIFIIIAQPVSQSLRSLIVPNNCSILSSQAQLPPPIAGEPKAIEGEKRTKHLEHLRKAGSSDFSATPTQ